MKAHLGSFGKSQTMSLRTEEKEKTNDGKGTDQKDLSVTNQIMNSYRKQNGKIKRLEESEDDTFGGQPK